MKTSISEFTSEEELDEFFDNPVIQSEIDLREDEAKQRAWENMVELFLSEFVKVNDVKKLTVTMDTDKKINFEVIYRYVMVK